MRSILKLCPKKKKKSRSKIHTHLQKIPFCLNKIFLKVFQKLLFNQNRPYFFLILILKKNKFGGTKATGQSNKKAPRQTSDKECPEGWHRSKGIKVKQGRSQPHSPGWARVPLSSFYLKFRLIFLIFTQTLLIFFLILALQVAHPGRPWLCHWGQTPKGQAMALVALVKFEPWIKAHWNQYQNNHSSSRSLFLK